MIDETNQQSDGPIPFDDKHSPEPDVKSDDIAKLLIEKASVAEFKRHAAIGRQNATRGHKANLTAGYHYLSCQEMLNHKEKGPWFAAEAAAIGTTVRTLYTYINLAKEEVWIEQQPVRLAIFQNSTSTEQNKTIRKAMTEAAKMNIDFDAKRDEAANKETDQVADEQEEEGKDEAAVAAYVNAYTISIPDLPAVLRTALDKLQTTDKWKLFLNNIRIFLATNLVALGAVKGPVADLLHPNATQPAASDAAAEKDEKSESTDNSANS